MKELSKYIPNLQKPGKKGDALKELGRTTEANAAFAKATELGYSSV
jgi:predicted RNA polymerase sigma factor